MRKIAGYLFGYIGIFPGGARKNTFADGGRPTEDGTIQAVNT